MSTSLLPPAEGTSPGGAHVEMLCHSGVPRRRPRGPAAEARVFRPHHAQPLEPGLFQDLLGGGGWELESISVEAVTCSFAEEDIAENSQTRTESRELPGGSWSWSWDGWLRAGLGPPEAHVLMETRFLAFSVGSVPAVLMMELLSSFSLTALRTWGSGALKAESPSASFEASWVRMGPDASVP